MTVIIIPRGLRKWRSEPRVTGQRRATVKRRQFMTVAVCFGVCTVSVAHQSQTGAAPDAPATTQAQTGPPKTNPLKTGVDLAQLLQRKSLVFPDLATARGPLTSWDKFKLAANNSVSVSTFGAALVGAAYGQAINSPSGYGQGGSGYGKRFGSGMARAASANLFGTFLIASVLPRRSAVLCEEGSQLQTGSEIQRGPDCVHAQ